MPTSFLPYEPDQTFLLPPSPSDWLSEDHLVYFISDIIDRLDLQKFYARYEGDGRRFFRGSFSGAELALNRPAPTLGQDD